MEESRAELLRRLAAGPARIEAAARLASGDPRLTTAPSAAGASEAVSGPAPWTPREIVAHLLLVEQRVFHVRLDDLAGPGVPRWSWSDPGTSAAPAVATLDRALAAFAAARAETIRRVRALDDEGWRRFGDHETLGRLDVAALLEVAVDHDEEHRVAIEATASGTPG